MSEEAFYLSPEFWVAISFLVFAVLVFRPVFRVIVAALDARSALIAGELAEVRRLREDAQAMLLAYQKKQRESLAEAEAMLVKTREDARRMGDQAETELKVAMDKRMGMAMEKIAQSETKALQDVQNHVVDIAIAAARSLIQEHLSRGGNEELVKQAASELERKLH